MSLGGKSASLDQPFGRTIALGLRANWRQFALLVVVNAFVGGMVGLERTVMPLLAERDFALVSRTAMLSFIVSFGIVKALANLVAGRLSDRTGRKRILVAGWLLGLPVPFLVIFAPSWGWIVFANVLLGLNQGLCWSMTIVMKIDLVGPLRRGFAMGLNEAAGYGAVSITALASGFLAATYGLRPAPFYLGVVFGLAGLILSVFFVDETHGHARLEAQRRASTAAREITAISGALPASQSPLPWGEGPVHFPLPAGEGQGEGHRPHQFDTQLSFGQIFLITSWKDRALFATSQAGLVNNLNDGMAWGLFPVFFAVAGLDLPRVAILAAVYPAVWGIGQLATGALSDRLGRKRLIVGGMWTQAVGIGVIVLTRSFTSWLGGMALLGLGTALVYPTLLAAISDVAAPDWRASAVGVYRLWRDGGYAFGALLAGVLADRFGLTWAIATIGALTFASGAVAMFRMYETLPRRPLEVLGP